MSKALAKTDNAITPVQQIGQEIAMIEGYDADFRFSMRKLGNIHLGVKVQANGKEYPKATEYFVLPDLLREDPEFRDKLEEMGENPDGPKRLPIMLMSDSIAANLITSCDCYGMGGKLKCRTYGGGTCQKLNEKTLQYEEQDCDPSRCPMFAKGDCAWYHRFRFTIPDCQQLGYWQVATKSKNNRGALVREMFDLRKFLGSIAGRDLVLVLVNDRTFHVPAPDKQNGGSKMISTTPYLLHLQAPVSLRKLMDQKPRGEVVDAEIIEESFDLDEPVVSEDDFPVGIEAEPVDAPTQEEADRQTLRDMCADWVAQLKWSQQKYANFIKTTFHSNVRLEDLDKDQLIALQESLQAEATKGDLPL